jgi:uncharacterized damage-inducible protein DinB
MALGQSLLPEFDQEMRNTRVVLERVPEEKLGWKPHEKSGTLGWLATHLAMLPLWATMTLDTDGLDLGAPFNPPPMPTSRAELVALFDKNLATAREKLAAATDERLKAEWRLHMGERTIFTMPRIGVLRGSVLNHMIHHRGQMTVYLRLNDVPLPPLYGPTADEGSL